MSARATSLTLPSSQAGKVLVAVLFAVLTGLASRVVVYLPGSPVPFTLQVLPVLLSGLLLGWRGGTLAQGTYVLAVLSGLPLDSGMRGTAALVGPTGGYLLGFVVAAATAGWVGRRSILGRDRPFLAALCGLGVLYLCGASWLAAHASIDARAAWLLGVKPFIGADLAKAMLGAATTKALRNRISSR